jgi:hypothetical protein
LDVKNARNFAGGTRHDQGAWAWTWGVGGRLQRNIEFAC